MTALLIMGLMLVGGLVVLGAHQRAKRLATTLILMACFAPWLWCWCRALWCHVPPLDVPGPLLASLSLVAVFVAAFIAVVRFVRHRRALTRFVGEPHSAHKQRLERD